MNDAKIGNNQYSNIYRSANNIRRHDKERVHLRHFCIVIAPRHNYAILKHFFQIEAQKKIISLFASST